MLFRSGATIGRPHKTNGVNQTKRERMEEIQNAVGAGALDSPLYINVFSGRRRRRPLPRYRETVYFFSAKWLCEHNTGGCKHTPLRSVASLLRKHCPRPTEIERDRLLVRSRKIVRTTLRREQAPALPRYRETVHSFSAKGLCEQRCGNKFSSLKTPLPPMAR